MREHRDIRHARLRAVKPHPRRGAALLLLLVFLGLAAVFLAGWVTSAAVARRADRLAEWRMQASWLAESGVARAATQLAQDPGYQGETWRTTAEQLADGYTGIVEIAIERETDADNRQNVQAIVEAQLHDGDETVARSRKQVLIRQSEEESS